MKRYRSAVGDNRLVFCRLVCSNTELSRRISLRHRDDPEGMAWHLRRAPELSEILNRAGGHDGVVDTTGRTPAEAAGRVLRQLDSVPLAGGPKPVMADYGDAYCGDRTPDPAPVER